MLARQHFIEAGAPAHFVDRALASGLGWSDLLKLMAAYGPALWTVVQAAVNSGWDVKAVLLALLQAIGSMPAAPSGPAHDVSTP